MKGAMEVKTGDEKGEEIQGEIKEQTGKHNTSESLIQSSGTQGQKEECPKCRRKVVNGVICEQCDRWWHYSCQGTTKKRIEEEYGKSAFQLDRRVLSQTVKNRKRLRCTLSLGGVYSSFRDSTGFNRAAL